MGSLSTYIIIDFEATCTNAEEFDRDEMEIIEFGVAAVDATTLLPVAEFSSFVRPVRNPKLTEFCRQLTTITQDDVDNAEEFSVVLDNFSDWLSAFEQPLFCSWGKYDFNQLHRDCEYHGVDYPFASNDHVNLKQRFVKSRPIKMRQVGLARAMKIAGIPLAGTLHRGIDDARNMAKLLPLMF